MSLSTHPPYLHVHGVKAEGGPHDGKYLDDSPLLRRRLLGYRLYGKADGSLVYKWEADLAAIDEEPA